MTHPVHAALPALAELADPRAYLARHSRSFGFSSAPMPRESREAVARIYAWCRYTDNLVDGDVSVDVAERRLETWLRCSWDAYEGRDCGVELVNRVMGEMADRAIPFVYAHDLVRAMQSDLRFAPFADLDALRVYTYRAAGVVGRWLTELHDVRDSWMLERATALGRAMQCTNILRDVGEDLERGRLYLPLADLHAHGLTTDDVYAMRNGTREIDGAYRALMEGLMAAADADYDFAGEAIPHLPRAFRSAAAVARGVYRGIHDVIRLNAYDNLRRRAYTTTARKVVLAGVALIGVSRARARLAVFPPRGRAYPPRPTITPHSTAHR